MSEDNVIVLFKKDEFPLNGDEKRVIVEKVLQNESPAKKMDRAEKDFKVEAKNMNVAVEDGHQFIKNLKKEAGRQKAIKAAESLELQTRPVEFLPTVESVSEEIELADSFELTEE